MSFSRHSHSRVIIKFGKNVYYTTFNIHYFSLFRTFYQSFKIKQLIPFVTNTSNIYPCWPAFPTPLLLHGPQPLSLAYFSARCVLCINTLVCTWRCQHITQTNLTQTTSVLYRNWNQDIVGVLVLEYLLPDDKITACLSVCVSSTDLWDHWLNHRKAVFVTSITFKILKYQKTKKITVKILHLDS